MTSPLSSPGPQDALSGRVALITGGGRGIGRAHAQLFAQNGASVVVVDNGASLDGLERSSGVAGAVVAEIIAAGGSAVAHEGDISRSDGAREAVACALAAFGRLDVVVNNAGIGGDGALIGASSAEGFEAVFAANFYGTLWVTQAAWPHMVAQRFGRVINTVSEAAFDSEFPASGLAYATSKAAVWSLTTQLAKEAPAGAVTVNAISPGAFTRMNEKLFQSVGRPALDLDPVHVARVAVWLASEEAGDVNGKVIHAAAGRHREYLVGRKADTPLVARLQAAIEGASEGKP